MRPWRSDAAISLPRNWATTNANLGNALVAIAERENSNIKLEEAASAYRAALEARPAEAAPLDTAKTHINLAYTLGASVEPDAEPEGAR